MRTMSLEYLPTIFYCSAPCCRNEWEEWFSHTSSHLPTQGYASHLLPDEAHRHGRNQDESAARNKEELTSAANDAIISKRERQILQLIASGMESMEIAAALNISKNTVSRHRQEILAKLQVKNSIEACRLASSMG
ncbi:MAG: LuxR C-terminal-related transcriptional regulator, partial [Muribaculaceae bacterium]|nr:LuxR C-terminal-related transcriptional regulator [Muribaculaceae bacterium]